MVVNAFPLIPQQQQRQLSLKIKRVKIGTDYFHRGAIFSEKNTIFSNSCNYFRVAISHLGFSIVKCRDVTNFSVIFSSMFLSIDDVSL